MPDQLKKISELCTCVILHMSYLGDHKSAFKTSLLGWLPRKRERAWKFQHATDTVTLEQTIVTILHSVVAAVGATLKQHLLQITALVT